MGASVQNWHSYETSASFTQSRSFIMWDKNHQNNYLNYLFSDIRLKTKDIDKHRSSKAKLNT